MPFLERARIFAPKLPTIPQAARILGRWPSFTTSLTCGLLLCLLRPSPRPLCTLVLSRPSLFPSSASSFPSSAPSFSSSAPTLLASSSAVPVLPMASANRARVHVSPLVPLTPFSCCPCSLFCFCVSCAPLLDHFAPLCSAALLCFRPVLLRFRRVLLLFRQVLQLSSRRPLRFRFYQWLLPTAPGFMFLLSSLPVLCCPFVSCAPPFGCPLYTLVYCSLYALIESSYCSSFKLSGVIFPARRSVKMRFLMIRAVGLVSYFNVVLRVIFCNDLVRMHSVQRNAHIPIGPCRAGTGRQTLHSRCSCADPERER